jgi:hypothetical protein
MIDNSGSLSSFADPQAIMGMLGKAPPSGPTKDLWMKLMQHLGILSNPAGSGLLTKTTGEAPSGAI